MTVPDSLTSIDDYVFALCSGLKNFTISDSVTSIGKGAFSDCENLTIITIPGNVTSIGENAFYGCKNLKDVYISEKTVKLGKEILGKYDSDISCHVVKTSDVYVHTPAGSAAEKYMKQYSGVYVVNDYGEDK